MATQDEGSTLVLKSKRGGAISAYQKARRHILGALVILLFALLAFGQSYFPPENSIHEGLEMFGILLIILGIAGRLWSTLYIGGRKITTIVQTGPYSITRNPLYLFSTLAAAGVGAQMGSFTAMIGFALLCALAFNIVIRREEQFLGGIYGKDYQAYLQRVPRFWPRPSLYDEGEPMGFQPDRLKRTLLDGLVFLVAMPVFELIDTLQLSGHLPVLFRLP